MIWKTVLVISAAHYVLSEHEKGAVSEQRISLHHSKSHNIDHPNGDKNSEHQEEYAWENPSYEFSYKVNDPHTHDLKGQNEKRHGDEVKGLYWLLEPNGHKRTVSYNANGNKGFKAQVVYASNENHDENRDDNNEYSVHEEQIEDIVQNKNEENNNETSNKEKVEEENNQEKHEEPQRNEDEKNNENNNDNYKENESSVDKSVVAAEEEGENVEVVVRPNGFNNDNARLEYIKKHDIKRTNYENHKETKDNIEKYGDRNERRKKINLNKHAEQINNSRQEKKKQGKNIISNNVSHKTVRTNEDTNQINDNERRFKDQLSENKDEDNQTNSNKSKSKTKEKESDNDEIYFGKLDDNNSQNNDDNESQIYEHRIFINHPKISASKQKKHRH